MPTLTSLLKNPLVICLALAAAIVYVLSTSIVKVAALTHPLHSEAASVRKNIKVVTDEIKHPDGTVETHTTSTDTTASDSHKDEKPQSTEAIADLWAHVAYAPLTGIYSGRIEARFGPLEAGVENPVALEFQPKISAGLRIYTFH